MKSFHSVGLLTLLLTQACAQSTPDAMLSAHRWQHRLLLLFAPSADHDLLRHQQQLAQAAAIGYADRDVRIYQITPQGGKQPDGTAIEAAAARAFFDRYEVPKDQFAALLIGKDGGEKLRQTGELMPTERLFGVIDAMPMRQREMRDDG